MPEHYHIRVKGHLDPSWSGWFDGLTITHEPDGSTTLAGSVVDSSALYGVIAKARNLGLTLLALQLISDSEAEEPHAEQHEQES